MNDTIKKIIEALPNGFDPDWPVDFQDDAGERHICNGAGDIDSLPETARPAARRYWREVETSIAWAQDAEKEVVIALHEGRYDDARDALEEAARCERQWGDDPTYYTVNKLMKQDQTS